MAGKDSTHLGKMTKRKDSQKLGLKRYRLGKIEGREIKGSLSKEHPGTESQQMAFRKTGLKEENYEKWRKNQPSEWLA